MAIETSTSGIVVNSDVGANANSYASIADAISQWSLDPHKQDYPTDDDVIARALITATADIDLEFSAYYEGELYDESYALYFPRTGLVDNRGVKITDYTVFPSDLIKATIDQAYYTNASDRKADSSANISQFTEQTLDGVGTVKYGSAVDQKIATSVSTIKDEVRLYLRSFVSSGSSKYSITMSRG